MGTQVTAEQRTLLDAAELAPVVELIDLLHEGGVASPAVLIEATRGSPHAALFQQVAAETMTGSDDEQSAQADWRGAFLQLELVRVQSEYQRLTAGGARNEAERQRFQELSRRLAELKGAASAGVRPEA